MVCCADGASDGINVESPVAEGLFDVDGFAVTGAWVGFAVVGKWDGTAVDGLAVVGTGVGKAVSALSWAPSDHGIREGALVASGGSSVG